MPTDAPPGAIDVAAAWAQTLTGLRETQLQVGWIREQVERLGAARAADVLTVVLARAEQREAGYGVLLLRVSLALATPQLSSLKRAVARIARLREQAGLACFLDADGDAADATPEGGPAEPTELPAKRTEGSARPLSLGERKSLARKRDRNLLARVLRDPHPDVVRIVLDNPALTEIDVVRLCARRPVRHEVLAQVFVHTRWIVRYRVRLALALNPHTPEPIALQLLPHLTPQDRRAVERSGDVSERVRAACSATAKGVLH